MCMMKNLALDPITGSDPDGIKLRSAEGFNAADYFVGNDWFTANYWWVNHLIRSYFVLCLDRCGFGTMLEKNSLQSFCFDGLQNC
jgi:hypothetical protein